MHLVRVRFGRRPTLRSLPTHDETSQRPVGMDLDLQLGLKKQSPQLDNWTGYTRTIMTSVDFIRAAAVWPLRNCISRAASAVMMEVIC